MKKLDINNWNRKKTYEWFSSFSNPCWSITKEIDVSNVVGYSKEFQRSFFVNMLYVVVRTLNEFEFMRMRCVNGDPVVYDAAKPAYTVMTESGDYENVRHEYNENYEEFYKMAKSSIDRSKKQTHLKDGDYNPKDCYDEYYITCLPWVSFSQVTHPIPDDKGSQSIPRLCWGKFFEKGEKIILNLNVTVSHMFCDGYDVARFYLKLQENIDNFKGIIM